MNFTLAVGEVLVGYYFVSSLGQLSCIFRHLPISIRRVRSVDISTGYGFDVRSLIPSSGESFFSSPQRSDLWPTQPPLQWVPTTLSPGVKLPASEADQLLQPPEKIKNSETVLLSPIRLHLIF
jgi:hypothetical protein